MDRENADAVHGKGVQGGTGPEDIRNGIVRPHFMEMGVGTVHCRLRCMDPQKDPAGHGKRRCRHVGSRCIEALHHLGKGPVSRCGVRVHFYGPDPFPGDGRNRRLCNNSSHCPQDCFPVCPAIKQGAGDHVARCTVERIEDEDPHYQYL